MAQGRMLKKRISKSQKFAALKTNNARLLYLMIYPHLDCDGRLEANPKLVKGQILPLLNYTLTKIKEYLEDMNRVGLTVLYENNGELFIEYTRFSDFQVLRKDREANSEIPPPSELQRNSVGTHPQVKLSKVKLSKVKFIAPTLEQVREYIQEKGYDVDAKKFFDFFTVSKWVDSKGNKVRNWKQKVITWSGRTNEKPKHEAGQYIR